MPSGTMMRTPKQTSNAITKATGNCYLHSPLVGKLFNYYQMDSLLCNSMKNYILFSDAIWFAANNSPQPAGRCTVDCKTLNITLISPCRTSVFHLASPAGYSVTVVSYYKN